MVYHVVPKDLNFNVQVRHRGKSENHSLSMRDFPLEFPPLVNTLETGMYAPQLLMDTRPLKLWKSESAVTSGLTNGVSSAKSSFVS